MDGFPKSLYDFMDRTDQEVGKRKHQDHKTIWAEAGAPGIGGSWYCYDCHEYFNSTVRILEPWEVV